MKYTHPLDVFHDLRRYNADGTFNGEETAKAQQEYLMRAEGRLLEKKGRPVSRVQVKTEDAGPRHEGHHLGNRAERRQKERLYRTFVGIRSFKDLGNEDKDRV